MSNEPFIITNATVVLPDRVIDRGAVAIDGGRIVEVAGSRATLASGLGDEVDAHDAFLIPGVIDLHNDSLETEVNPRPKANLPLAFALSNFERRLVASGVTTEFHAISFMNMEKSGRTVDQAAERTAYLARTRTDPHRVIDHHVLHRLDVWNPDAMDALFESVGAFPIGYVSLNDHTPGQGQYRDVPRYTEFMKSWRQQRGGEPVADGEVLERMAARQADTMTIPAVYARVRARREASSFILSTHDDDSPEKVDRQWEIGATIAEFPITIESALRARDRGMAIVVGAPNIVRGGSTSGNQDAMELFELGLADIICADYHAPSLLLAAFMLVQQGVVELPAAIRALTLNPARAVGLPDVGAIQSGYRADLALVNVGADGLPRVEAVYRNGREVFALRERVPVGGAAW